MGASQEVLEVSFKLPAFGWSRELKKTPLLRGRGAGTDTISPKQREIALKRLSVVGIVKPLLVSVKSKFML